MTGSGCAVMTPSLLHAPRSMRAAKMSSADKRFIMCAVYVRSVVVEVLRRGRGGRARKQKSSGADCLRRMCRVGCERWSGRVPLRLQIPVRVRIPIPDSGRRRLCIVPSVASGHMLLLCSVCGRRRCADGGRGYLRGSFRSGPKLAGAILHSGRSSDSFPAVRLPDRRVSGVVHDITSAEAELTAASTVPASHRIPF